MKRIALILILFPFLAACNAREVTVTRLVEVTRLVGDAVPDVVEVTRLVPVTPTSDPAGASTAPTAFITNNPTTLTTAVESDPVTLDPALAVDPAGAALLRNVVEPLIYPDPEDPSRFLPLLASEWRIADDGLTYTFTIRRDVAFSNGNDLTAADVAYSFRRGLLQSAPGGPQHLLIEPLLGYVAGDITAEIDNGAYAGNREALLANATPDVLVAVCERVKDAVAADDPAGTVTFTLAQPWGPFLTTLAQTWGGIVDQEWAIAQGAWDGDCATWQNWYAPGPAGEALATTILGTGPYLLDHWTPGVAYVLRADDTYWRAEDEPLWEGGPAGTPAIPVVEVQVVPEPEQRLARLREGAIDAASLPPAGQALADQYVGERCSWQMGECQATGDPAGPLRKIAGIPHAAHSNLFFNFDILTADNPYIGSGQLDGNGIPPNFFDDANVRRAFSYCFDETAFLETTLDGNGIITGSLVPPSLLGNNPGQPRYAFNLQDCNDAFVQAWDNQLLSTGFHFQIPIDTGNDLRAGAAAVLQANLRAVNPNFKVEIVSLPPALYQEALRARTLPLAFLDVGAMLPDPHNWISPAFTGAIATFQEMPVTLHDQFVTLVNSGVTTTDPAGRREVYADLDRLRYDMVPNILLPHPAGSLYLQRWVQNWFYNPTAPEPYYYAYSLNGG